MTLEGWLSVVRDTGCWLSVVRDTGCWLSVVRDTGRLVKCEG